MTDLKVFSEEFLLSNGFKKELKTSTVHATDLRGNYNTHVVGHNIAYTFKGVEIDLTADQCVGIEPCKDERTDLERLFECIGKSFVKDFKNKIGDL